jgi:diguanylate cyclase (GGDEF)-like protein
MGDMETAKTTTEIHAEMLKMVSDHEKVKHHLLRVINTYGLLVESFSEYSNDALMIKKLLSQEQEDWDDIDKRISQLREKIFSNEVAEQTPAAGQQNGFDSDPINCRKSEILRMLRRTTHFFLDNFYPLAQELEQKAETIQIPVRPDVSEDEIAAQVTAFLDYSRALKQKILLDFSAVNASFKELLTQVYQLESVISSEFNASEREKQFATFENSIGKEMGAISEAFAFKKNISELKAAVVDRLGNIRLLIEQKKHSEKKQLDKANATIKRLKKKISLVNAEARKMSSKAKTYQREALFDGLTQVHNRKSFEMRLSRELAMLDGDDTVALILFDIDRFKWLNDTFGHVAGDKVLMVVANHLKTHFRKSDFVARYGGDEFVVLVNGLTPERVQERIDRFKTGISKIKFISHARKSDIKVSISAGMAMAETGDTGAMFLHRADQAMYEDKKRSNRGDEATTVP